MKCFVSAIGTDSGKTLVSAILCEAFGADYWKPIQAGKPTDSYEVKKLLTNTRSQVYPERYLLKTPASPHAAAKLDRANINITDFDLPETTNDLIIEGAGGLMVPLNEDQLMIDLISYLKLDVILVSNLYLGSINHSLLSIEALKNRRIKLKGIIFNGPSNPDSESVILKYAKTSCLLHIDRESIINKEVICNYAQKLLLNWK